MATISPALPRLPRLRKRVTTEWKRSTLIESLGDLLEARIDGKEELLTGLEVLIDQLIESAIGPWVASAVHASENWSLFSNNNLLPNVSYNRGICVKGLSRRPIFSLLVVFFD